MGVLLQLKTTFRGKLRTEIAQDDSDESVETPRINLMDGLKPLDFSFKDQRVSLPLTLNKINVQPTAKKTKNQTVMGSLSKGSAYPLNYRK